MAIKTECPVCRCSKLVPFLLRERVPVHQNLLMIDADSARNIERGDLDLVVCRDCGFIFNRAFDASKMCYGPYYESAQLASPCFRNFLDGLIKHLIDEKHIRNRRILDVGCGDGLFLRKLVEDEAYGNIGLGFDPAYTGPDKSLDGRLTFWGGTTGRMLSITLSMWSSVAM